MGLLQAEALRLRVQVIFDTAASQPNSVLLLSGLGFRVAILESVGCSLG